MEVRSRSSTCMGSSLTIPFFATATMRSPIRINTRLRSGLTKNLLATLLVEPESVPSPAWGHLYLYFHRYGIDPRRHAVHQRLLQPRGCCLRLASRSLDDDLVMHGQHGESVRYFPMPFPQ